MAVIISQMNLEDALAKKRRVENKIAANSSTGNDLLIASLTSQLINLEKDIAYWEGEIKEDIKEYEARIEREAKEVAQAQAEFNSFISDYKENFYDLVDDFNAPRSLKAKYKTSQKHYVNGIKEHVSNLDKNQEFAKQPVEAKLAYIDGVKQGVKVAHSCDVEADKIFNEGITEGDIRSRLFDKIKDKDSTLNPYKTDDIDAVDKLIGERVGLTPSEILKKYKDKDKEGTLAESVANLKPEQIELIANVIEDAENFKVGGRATDIAAKFTDTFNAAKGSALVDVFKKKFAAEYPEENINDEFFVKKLGITEEKLKEKLMQFDGDETLAKLTELPKGDEKVNKVLTSSKGEIEATVKTLEKDYKKRIDQAEKDASEFTKEGEKLNSLSKKEFLSKVQKIIKSKSKAELEQPITATEVEKTEEAKRPNFFGKKFSPVEGVDLTIGEGGSGGGVGGSDASLTVGAGGSGDGGKEESNSKTKDGRNNPDNSTQASASSDVSPQVSAASGQVATTTQVTVVGRNVEVKTENDYVEKFDSSQVTQTNAEKTSAVQGATLAAGYRNAIENSGRAIVTESAAASNLPNLPDPMQEAIRGLAIAGVTLKSEANVVDAGKGMGDNAISVLTDKKQAINADKSASFVRTADYT